MPIGYRPSQEKELSSEEYVVILHHMRENSTVNFLFGNCLPGTELLETPFMTELSKGSISRSYRQSRGH